MKITSLVMAISAAFFVTSCEHLDGFDFTVESYDEDTGTTTKRQSSPGEFLDAILYD